MTSSAQSFRIPNCHCRTEASPPARLQSLGDPLQGHRRLLPQLPDHLQFYRITLPPASLTPLALPQLRRQPTFHPTRIEM